MVRSSKWSGHSPFKAVMRGSNPARITTLGYGQEVKAPVFDIGTAGSNPAIPAMIWYSSGLREQSAKLSVAGSNPARISSGKSPQTIAAGWLSADFHSVTTGQKQHGAFV